MKNSVEIRCLNNGKRKRVEFGTDLKSVAEEMKITLKYPILGALVNNQLKEFSYLVYNPKTIRFIDITHPDGMRMYVRSLTFVLSKAIKELYPQANLKLEHSVSKGFYCEIENLGEELNEQIVSNIRNRMRKIIDKNLPFIREQIPTEEAIELFAKHNMPDKAKLFSTRGGMYTSIYYLEDCIDYFYGFLVPSTGYLKVFDLVKYYDGMLLRKPNQENPEELDDIVKQSKMFEIFQEHKNWVKILNVENVGSLNDEIIKGNTSELIKISEALHEKKVGQIADLIYHKKDKVKVVLISGPSSSGKTTTCKRLAIQLKVAGLKPVMISLDNYFVDREFTPKDEKGDFDFECLEAIDVGLFVQNINDLLAGKEVDLPEFNFGEGRKYYHGKKLQIGPEHILIVEGIHGLNPKLTAGIPDEAKFKVYVSALTQVAIDDHNRIPTTDNRLLRRMIRDFKYRKYSALNTLKRWPSVRNGEEKYIFPFQEEADVMFNSAMAYELCVLKHYAEPLLKDIPENEPENAEAVRLLKFLSYFKNITDTEIGPTSILREFLGGSSFKY